MSIVKYVNNQNLRKDRTPRDSNLAGGVFNYDRYKGNQGTGPGNTIFGTTRKFTPDDGSLQVFLNGVYKYQDIGNGSGGDYQVIDSQSIRFLVTINSTDDVVLLVNGGTIVRDASQNNFNNITELFGDVYYSGTGVMFNTGNKAFAGNYNLESLTFLGCGSCRRQRNAQRSSNGDQLRSRRFTHYGEKRNDYAPYDGKREQE
jgi:hypothetical protein